MYARRCVQVWLCLQMAALCACAALCASAAVLANGKLCAFALLAPVKDVLCAIERMGPASKWQWFQQLVCRVDVCHCVCLYHMAVICVCVF